MSTATKATKYTGKSQGEGESILAYVQRQLRERPVDINGSEPYMDQPGTSFKRRSSRPYFIGSKMFPKGLEIGGSELYMQDAEEDLRLFSFVPDIGAAQMEILDCIVNERPYITPQERREQRERRDKRATEMKHFGRAVDTATSEEQVMSALAVVGDPALRKEMLKAALAKMERDEAK